MARGLAALLALSLVMVVSATPACDTRVDSSSHMFGARWLSSFSLYEQETQWRQKGDISKINLYYDAADGCVRGVKPTYGADPANARRLGTEASAAGVAHTTTHIVLGAGEVVVKGEYKYTTRCIEYLRLTTSKGRSVAIGNAGSTSALQTTAPNGALVAGGATRFLACFKGYTDVPNTSARAGRLQQLQLVWALRTCPAPSPSPSPPPPPVVSVPSPSPTPSTVCSPNAGLGCANGKCPTSGCTLSGLGFEVLSMAACYGRNAKSNLLLDLAGSNPCANLACKLDKPGCSSSGLLGVVGGFCTGTIVSAPGVAASSLSARGRSMLSYPCVEWANPLLALLPGDDTAAGKYVSKAWKACDCNRFLGFTNASVTSGVSVTTTLPTLTTLPSMTVKAYSSLFSKPLVDITLPGATAQWLAAAAARAPLQALALEDDKVAALAALLPGLSLPALVVPSIAAPLLKLPANFSLPVVSIADSKLADIAELIPDLTSLATVLTAVGLPPLSLPTNLTLVPDLTAPSFKQLAAFFQLPSTAASTISTLPSLGLALGSQVPLLNMTLSDAVKQWSDATALGLSLPQLTVDAAKVAALKALLPNLTLPAVLLPNVSLPLFKKPANLSLPVFVVPPAALKGVTTLLPNLTSLATLVLPDVAGSLLLGLPLYKLPQVSIPGLSELAASLQLPGLPSLSASVPAATALPSLGDMNLTHVVQQWLAANIMEVPLPSLSVSDAKLLSLKALVSGFKLPCIVVPKLAAPFFLKPANLTLPVFSIPDGSLKAIAAVLPDLSSLPTLLGKNATQLLALPGLSLKLPNVTAAASLGGVSTSLGVFVSAPAGGLGLGASITSYASLTIPGLPRLPSLAQLAAVDTSKLLGFFNVLGVLGGEGGLVGLLPGLDLSVLGLPPLQASLAKLNLTSLGLSGLDLGALPGLADFDLADMSSLSSLPGLAQDAWSQLSGSFGVLRTLFGSASGVAPASAPAGIAVDEPAGADADASVDGQAQEQDQALADEEPTFGPETAYMDPEEFAALTPEEQANLLASLG